MTNFTDRNTYKAFVTSWKITYAENSELIRQTKRDMKVAAREGRFAEASNLQARREYLRADQRRALVVRAEAKVEAQRQYLAALEAKVAA